MPYSCSVDGCKSNYPGSTDKVPVFDFPPDDEMSKRWERFAAGQRKGWCKNSSSKVCSKHFEANYLKMGEGPNGRTTLLRKLKPVPTIFSPGSADSPLVSHMKVPVSIPRKSPRKRLYQEDQYERFLDQDVIKSFDDINEKMIPSGFVLTRYAEHLVIYEMKTSELSVPEVHSCLRVDSDLHVKLFYKGSPIPLPEWFRKGRDCRFTRRSMLQNLISYVKLEGEQTSHIFDELLQLRFQKKPRFSRNIIRYAILLRYTSLQAYNVVAKDFPFPSLSFLRKITQGGIDAVKSLKLLKEKGKISKDVILMLDEMYLDKCEEYDSGKLIGADAENNLYKGAVLFMVVGLKESVLCS